MPPVIRLPQLTPYLVPTSLLLPTSETQNLMTGVRSQICQTHLAPTDLAPTEYILQGPCLAMMLDSVVPRSVVTILANSMASARFSSETRGLGMAEKALSLGRCGNHLLIRSRFSTTLLRKSIASLICHGSYFQLKKKMEVTVVER